jgi:tight junction protein 1
MKQQAEKVFLQVNKKSMQNVTREEAVLYLLSVKENVEMTVQYRKDEYERVKSQNLGDSFYVR